MFSSYFVSVFRYRNTKRLTNVAFGRVQAFPMYYITSFMCVCVYTVTVPPPPPTSPGNIVYRYIVHMRAYVRSMCIVYTERKAVNNAMGVKLSL